MQKDSLTDYQSQNTLRNNILVVEDDIAIAQIITLTVDEETPFRARYVTTPREALYIIDDLHPILLLIDYQLPGLNGLQLYDQICVQEHLRHIPAIMMSANLPWAELRKRELVGLEKPFDLDDLLALIEKMVR